MPPEKPEQNNPTSPEKQDPQSPLHSLRTYQGDVEEALAKNKTSVSSIVIAEQKRRDSVLQVPEEQARTGNLHKRFIIIGALLVLIGIIALVFVYETKPTNLPITPMQTKVIIGFSEQAGLPLTNTTREKVLQAIQKERGSFNLPPNSVLYINMTNASGTPARVEDVLSFIAPRMPGSLARSFEEQYMFGIYSFDINAPFIILTTNDYATSYSGMLKWEEGMVADVGGMFGVLGTSTPAFADKSLQNRDLRVLRDGSGKIVLLYSFIDKHTLVITSQENILTGIVGKYLTSKTIR